MSSLVLFCSRDLSGGQASCLAGTFSVKASYGAATMSLCASKQSYSFLNHLLATGPLMW